MAKVRVWAGWVGFVNDKPHVDNSCDTYGDLRSFDVFLSRIDCARRFADHRRVRLVEDAPPKRKRR